MIQPLRSMLFSRALPGETAGELAARYGVAFDVLLHSRQAGASTDLVGARLITLPWAASSADPAATGLGKLVLDNENAVLTALAEGLKSVDAPERITHTPLQWDFAALGTIASFTVSDGALVVTTDEGIGAVERLSRSDSPGASGASQAIARLCETLSLALAEHRSRRLG